MPYNIYNTEDNLCDHDRIDLFFWVHNLDRSQKFFYYIKPTNENCFLRKLQCL